MYSLRNHNKLLLKYKPIGLYRLYPIQCTTREDYLRGFSTYLSCVLFTVYKSIVHTWKGNFTLNFTCVNHVLF